MTLNCDIYSLSTQTEGIDLRAPTIKHESYLFACFCTSLFLFYVFPQTDIHYFHCLRIVEILKGTEASSKNIFGRYSSQRMKVKRFK